VPPQVHFPLPGRACLSEVEGKRARGMVEDLRAKEALRNLLSRVYLVQDKSAPFSYEKGG